MAAIQFWTRPGGDRIAYRFVAPKGKGGDRPVVLFLPGYASDMTGTKATAIAEWAASKGVGCLLFDYGGCGQSDGAFDAQTLADWRDDALGVIEDAAPGAPILLVGSSMGGWIMVLLQQILGNRVTGMIGIAAAPDFTNWGFADLERSMLRNSGRLEQDNPYGPEPTVTTLGFYDSGQSLLVLDADLPGEQRVTLIHGQADEDVPYEVSLHLAKQLGSASVQTILIKDGDHRLSRPQDLAVILGALDDMVRAA